MENDDLVRRIQERQRQAREAAERDERERDEHVRSELRTSRRAAFALLADIRRNLPAIVSANELDLRVLTVVKEPRGGTGRDSTAWPRFQVPGWRLHHGSKWYRYGEGQGETVTFEEYLLADGRLARLDSNRLVTLCGDNWFWVLTMSLETTGKNVRASIAALYQRAGLAPPKFPAIVDTGGSSRDLRQELDNEPFPEPPPGVRYYSPDDHKQTLAPPPARAPVPKIRTWRRSRGK